MYNQHFFFKVLNKYIYELGASSDWQVIDVYALDRESLDFIAQPVKCVVLLFPCSDNYEAHRKKEDEELKKNPDTFSEDLFYTRQFSRNACGTVALIHGILNNKDIELKDNSVLKNYFDKAKSLTPEERGKLLDSDKEFATCHETIAQEGQTAAPSSDEKIYYHFVTFVGTADGDLIELDGSKNMPVKHLKNAVLKILCIAHIRVGF